jgi:hypothetical protein
VRIRAFRCMLPLSRRPPRRQLTLPVVACAFQWTGLPVTLFDRGFHHLVVRPLFQFPGCRRLRRQTKQVVDKAAPQVSFARDDRCRVVDLVHAFVQAV